MTLDRIASVVSSLIAVCGYIVHNACMSGQVGSDFVGAYYFCVEMDKVLLFHSFVSLDLGQNFSGGIVSFKTDIKVSIYLGYP